MIALDTLMRDAAYLCAAMLAVPYFLFRWLQGRPRYRAGLLQRFGHIPKRQGPNPCLWVHASSFGEVKALQSFLPALHAALPDWQMVLSAFSHSGYQAAGRMFPWAMTCFFPLDVSCVVRRHFTKIRPDVIVLVEKEFWPNFLAHAAHRKVPVFLVNGRMTARSLRRMQWVDALVRWRKDAYHAVCACSESDRTRFAAWGLRPERLVVTGNMKYDNLQSRIPDEDLLRYRRLFDADGARVLLGGSTFAPEEKAILAIWKELAARWPDARLILAPRHIERTQEVVQMIQHAGLRAVLRTQMKTPTSLCAADIIVLNTLGELSTVYGIAALAFVGGSLVPRGGQNFLEPAALGVATMFGNMTGNFSEEARLLLAQAGAVMVDGPEALKTEVFRLMGDPSARTALGRRGRQVVQAGQGASQRNVAFLKQCIDAFAIQNNQHNAGRRQ